MFRTRPGSCARLLLAALVALGFLGVGSCQRKGAPSADARISAVGERLLVDSQLPDDPRVDSLIAPYRAVFEERMSEPLAYCPVAMETGKPEGLLGALIADIVRERASREVGFEVDVCVLNNGGLRIPWPKGVITLGLVYEVMPFDNRIVVLRLSASQMHVLADEIASRGGEPVSGMTFEVADGRALRLRVGGKPVAERDYWVATSDYLAGGGGRMPTLWRPKERLETSVLVRDAIADALRKFGSHAVGAASEMGRVLRAGERARPGRIPVPQMGRVRVRR